MPQASTTGKRGRPPGTGKNDTDRLQKIAALMAADPALKPTTAIKQIGETDPSTIRRLRDKFHEQQEQLMTALARDVEAASPEPEMVSEFASVHIQHCAPEPAQRAAPLAVIAPKKSAPAAEATVVEFVTNAQPAQVQDPFMVFGKWFGNGIETAAMLFEHQMMFAQTMLKTAPMKAVWRQQLVATEYMLMLSGTGQRIAVSSHGKSA
jgi:hypothetical protein